jgi:predicted alpha-1,6-mannanase (GH76 family)
MELYDQERGQFLTAGWWNNANALTAVIDYAQATGDHRYDWVIANTYEKNIDQHYGNFTNEYIDDTGWWALAWIRAYDYTGEERYLAKIDAAYMWSYRDDVCGGGLWWRTDKTYKNAVTNELFIKIAAELHQRTGDQSYLDQAVEVWQWFDDSGMINDENLINDGLVLSTCESNGDTTWTYNQGIILGALTALAETTGDPAYLERAKALADASTTSSFLNPDGVLTEPCEPDCGADGPTFKGVYVRNLAELAAATDSGAYLNYLDRQAKVSWKRGRNDFNQYGLSWAGPFTGATASTHTSGFEAQTAPLRARQ